MVWFYGTKVRKKQRKKTCPVTLTCRKKKKKVSEISQTHSKLRHQRRGWEHDWAPYLSGNIANIQMPTTFQSKHLLRGSPTPPPPPPPVWTQPTRDYWALPSSPAWLARYQNETKNNDEDTSKYINSDEENMLHVRTYWSKLAWLPGSVSLKTTRHSEQNIQRQLHRTNTYTLMRTFPSHVPSVTLAVQWLYSCQ